MATTAPAEIRQLGAPEGLTRRLAGKARRRRGLAPTRRSNAASGPKRQTSGRAALVNGVVNVNE